MDAAGHGGSFELTELDLADLKSVRACTEELLANGERFDVIIANAGVMATPFGHTADGFETQFACRTLADSKSSSGSSRRLLTLATAVRVVMHNGSHPRRNDKD